ncbi:MFS transporter [Ralstonia sp. SET104]|uniref:MFS transporter n=1 Tax=Ralstonia sp. SET104 TaxID=2448774 RepID=UPI000F580FE4|nr:MFS transporter [Ralstonia sp. SET104]GCB03574.1 hypothetical protein PSUB009319_12050 [Ralstonia sp. SET104]
MPASPPLNITKFIDEHPLSPFQATIVILCFLVVAIDGFDTAAIGFIAPAIRAEWHLAAAQLAPLFGAGLAGLMAGAFIFGPLADRFGRKSVLMASVLFFGLAMLSMNLDMPTLFAVIGIPALVAGATMLLLGIVRRTMAMRRMAAT